jgi:hypothetical protein
VEVSAGMLETQQRKREYFGCDLGDLWMFCQACGKLYSYHQDFDDFLIVKMRSVYGVYPHFVFLSWWTL